jgi:dTDP-4-amino-4,6-dideoxygalactose transaminase
MRRHSEKLIPVAMPWLGQAESRAAARALRSGWVTQGPEVAAFEREFAAYVGAPYACAVSSCTTALHLALLAVGVRPGDEVITVSHSFIATANSILYCGAVPVFVDVESRTCNIDPRLVERAITSRTRAILCVHQVGMPCDLVAVLEIARRRKLPVVEDAACAIGSEIRMAGTWEKIGKPHGDVACFSFHPRKVITTGDGGMITTANPAWAEKFRAWRAHGVTIPAALRHHSRQVLSESYSELGYNYRMTDIQAAIGREQLKRLPSLLRKRRVLAKRYARLLTTIEGIQLPEEPAWARSNWQSYGIGLPARCSQHEIMQRLLDRGIATRRGVMCAHRESALHGRFRISGRGLRESVEAQDRIILLPLFAQMSEAEQRRVVCILEEACLPRRRRVAA